MTIETSKRVLSVETALAANGAFTVSAAINGTKFERTVTPDDPLWIDYAMFGAETKIRNTIGALAKDKKTPEVMLERAEAIFARHDEGEFNLEREAGEGAPSGGIVARAIAEVLDRPVDKVVAHVHSQFASIEDEKERKKQIRLAWESFEADQKFAHVIKRLRDEAAKVRAARAPKVQVSLAGL